MKDKIIQLVRDITDEIFGSDIDISISNDLFDISIKTVEPEPLVRFINGGEENGE